MPKVQKGGSRFKNVRPAIGNHEVKKQPVVIEEALKELNINGMEGKSISTKEALAKAKSVMLEEKRAAARASLEAMEKEVVIENNLQVMSEFKKLICGDDVDDGVGSQELYWGKW
ncbi:hypothetical protein ACFE04_004083 [Oxalis oulophora]